MYIMLFMIYMTTLHLKPMHLSHNTSLQEQLTSKSKKCVRKHNLFYLKVFKTASTTTSSIIYRFALKHSLTTVPNTYLYPYGHILNNTLLSLGSKHVQHQYNIMAEHLTFNKYDIRSLMPQNTVYMGGFRYPLSQFKSRFNHFQFAKRLKINSSNPVKVFLENITHYLSNMSPGDHYDILQDNMASAYGFPFATQNKITDVIEQIKQQFDMILIAEYYDESLLLFKRTMCWEIPDIIYLKQRELEYEYKHSPYSMRLRHTHQTISGADYNVYDYFVKKLHRTIALQSIDFWDELHFFRNVNNRVSVFCADVIEKLKKNTSSIYDMAKGNERIKLSSESLGQYFTVHAVDCAIMSLTPLKMDSLLLTRQMPEICSPTASNIKRKRGNKIYAIQRFTTTGPLHVHDAYCSKWNPVFNVPLDLLALKKSYINWP